MRFSLSTSQGYILAIGLVLVLAILDSSAAASEDLCALAVSVCDGTWHVLYR